MTDKIKLPIELLSIGMYVDLELAWDQHPFMFPHFKIKTEKDLITIRGLGLKRVTVLPDRSTVAIPSDPNESINNKLKDATQDDPAVKDKTATDYIERREQVTRRYREQAQKVKNIINDLSIQPANAVRDVDEVVNSLANNFCQSQDMMINLVNLGNGDHGAHNHAINVTMLSLMLGHGEGLSQDDMKLLGMGALLHDMGKVMLPKILMLASHVLTPAEEKLYERHTLLGRDLAQRVRDFPVEVLDIIYHHHEYLDGTGYPSGLLQTNIKELVRIVSVANVYDNLCNPHDITQAMTPKAAMATMFSKYKDKLDRHLIERFIKLLGVYPPGTVVELSTSEVGMVIAVNAEASMQPQLLIYNPAKSDTGTYIVNLQDTTDLSIINVIKPSEYPESLLEHLGIHERIGYMVESLTA